MSINVEIIGEAPMVQHYVEQAADRHYLVFVAPPWTNTECAKVGL
jgi:hypothetical protein